MGFDFGSDGFRRVKMGLYGLKWTQMGSYGLIWAHMESFVLSAITVMLSGVLKYLIKQPVIHIFFGVIESFLPPKSAFQMSTSRRTILAYKFV